MQKIKNFFKFIANKEFLIKVILMQVVILLFVIMTGNLRITIGIQNPSAYDYFKVKGQADIDMSGSISTN
jgi:hypothetical protein